MLPAFSFLCPTLKDNYTRQLFIATRHLGQNPLNDTTTTSTFIRHRNLSMDNATKKADNLMVIRLFF